MNLDLNLTTLFSVAITSVIQGIVTVLVVRYISRAADQIEKRVNSEKMKNGNGNRPKE